MDLDYVITNHSKKIFIRLGDGGVPETCSKNQCQYFTQKKANNVLRSLPKTMKKFHFMAIKMHIMKVPMKIKIILNAKRLKKNMLFPLRWEYG